MFSATCHYGLQAMFYIANHATKDINVGSLEIAEEQDIPKHFLSKILQLLVKHKLLVSTKGPSGGFKLGRDPKDITIIEVVEAIDGLDIFEQCGFGFKICDSGDPCPIHHDYENIRNKVYHLFKDTSLEELVNEVNNGKNFVSVGGNANTNSQNSFKEANQK